MKLQITALTAILLATHSDAFMTSAPQSKAFIHTSFRRPLQMTAQSSPDYQENEGSTEVERLRLMAQKLRSEAALLEAERAEEVMTMTEKDFRKFDLNGDGVISLDELKAGLEKTWKSDIPENRIIKLMRDFDKNSDGALQLEEFVTIERFRNRLEALVSEEKTEELEAQKAAQKEAESAKLMEARANLLNDKAPSNTDKLVSVLPYLLPLMDSLTYGQFLLGQNQDNPIVLALAFVSVLYRSIPFSGFLSFVGLNSLTNNLGVNKLVRYNSQQAIYLDIAMFLPGFLGLLVGAVASGAGINIPPALTELSSDLIFGTLVLSIAYAVVSSLLGVTPDKIPGISQRVKERMPTIDMFDMNGQFIPKELREKEDDETNKD
eukprot:CAMPEP_0194239328 /NCGR_PEP_ID=MMETSP0158-20130606/5829_1 /TAXON_ID=33649 /ORGANISM="Thalassionema nitzschioides, Strain L26-B" /LENGTH=377 /DNA_ID=CAMNT_0038973781 /DNA_START=152 /DNA_END=1285 /DNA_ORIENTATION=+